jgi:hypothetical protein
MKISFKLRSLKSYLVAALAALLFGGAVAGVSWYSFSDNPPAQLWGVDDTTWVPVAWNSDTTGPTRENPVYIEAQVERLYGLRIGTPIRVLYRIVALNSVHMRFDTLKKGILSRYKTTWRVVEPMKLVWEESKEGYTTRIVELTVAVWEPPSLPESVPVGAHTDFLEPPASDVGKPNLSNIPSSPVATAASAETAAATAAAPPAAATAAPLAGAKPEAAPPAEAAPAAPVEPQLWPFTAEFIVSTDEKNQPWKYIETPPINFGFSSLLEPHADEHGLDWGPLGDAPFHRNRVGIALVNGGNVITAGGVIYLGVLCFVWWRRRKLPHPVPEDVVRYRQAIESAQQAKHARSYLEQLRIAVREYLGGATLADKDLIELWGEHPRREKVAQALETLSQASRAGRLNIFDEEKITDAIDSLVEDRLRVDVPVTRWSRLRAAIWTRTTGLGRLVKPLRRITKLPSALRNCLRRRRS